MAGKPARSEPMSRDSTVMGSEDGFRLRLASNFSDEGPDPSETTGLLGAGGHDETAQDAALQQDSWDNMKDFEDAPWWRTPSVYWLIGPYALFTLAFGGVMVPKLNLIIDLVCKRYFSEQESINPGFTFLPVILGGNNPQCQIPEVQRSVATFSLTISVIVGTLSAFTAPRLGAFSDRHGRKPVMVISSAGGLVGEVITILAANYPDVIHYKWLIAAAVFDGLAGSFTAGSIMSHSYCSDCTPPSTRAVSIGYMHACLFIGMAFGPLLAGYFVEWTGSLLSIFYVTLGCHIVFILFIMFVLPESVSKRRQLSAREKHRKGRDAGVRRESFATSNDEGTLIITSVKMFYRGIVGSNPFAPLKVLVPRGPRLSKVRRNLIMLAAIDTILLGSAMSSGQVTLLYTEFVFHWGNFETSLFISLLSMVRVFVLMGIFPVINYFFRTREAKRQRRLSGVIPIERNAGADNLDVWLIRSAIISDVLGVCGYIFARDPRVFILCGVVTAFGGLGSATIQSSLTKHVPAERIGALLGAIGLLHAMSRVFAPVLFNGLYAATVGSFPQAVFVLLTTCFLLVLTLSFFVRPHVYMTTTDEPLSPVEPSRPGTADLAEEDVVPNI